MSKLKLLLKIALNSLVSKFTTREELELFQRKKIHKHFKYLNERSPYFIHLKPKELHDVPIMNKEFMMKNFDELNTVGIKKKEAIEVAAEAEKSRDFTKKLHGITVGLSSGTSGNKGIFLVSEEDKLKYVEVIYEKVLKPLKLKKTRVALFFRANSNLYESVKSSLLKFIFFDLTKELETQLSQLENFNPHILVATPSLLKILASIQKQKTLNIRPEKIISVAEILEDDVRKEITSAFGLTVHQLYQCTEGFLGSTCKLGKIHLHEDYIHFEKKWIDEDKKRFHPIITDFTRKTQPIVRYELNDILQEDDACECGSIFTVIKKIEGRSDDIFEFLNTNNKKITIFPDEIRNTLILASDLVENYSVKQVDKQTIEVAIKVGDENKLTQETEKVQTALNNLFIKKNLKQINILYKTYVNSKLSIKQRRIINESRS